MTRKAYDIEYSCVFSRKRELPIVVYKQIYERVVDYFGVLASHRRRPAGGSGARDPPGPSPPPRAPLEPEHLRETMKCDAAHDVVPEVHALRGAEYFRITAEP
jgi:hypothetical protein